MGHYVDGLIEIHHDPRLTTTGPRVGRGGSRLDQPSETMSGNRRCRMTPSPLPICSLGRGVTDRDVEGVEGLEETG